MNDRWLSVDEIAEYLGVSKDTVYTWVTGKGMPGQGGAFLENSSGRTWTSGSAPGVRLALRTSWPTRSRTRMAKASKKKATSEVTALEEGKILDYITGKPLKDSAKEQVRQRIARAPRMRRGPPSQARRPRHLPRRNWWNRRQMLPNQKSRKWWRPGRATTFFSA